MLTTILALALLPGQDPDAKARLVLRADAGVEGRFVRLLDLVEAGALDPATLRRLEEVWLGRAPEAGGTRIVSAEEIRRELERRGFRSGEFEISGECVAVRSVPPGGEQGTKRLQAMIEGELTAQRAAHGRRGRGDRCAVRMSYLSRTGLPDGCELVSVTPREPFRIGPLHFTAEVRLPGATETLALDGIARLCRIVPVAFSRRGLKRHHVLRTEDIAMQDLEVESEEGYCTDRGALVGGKLHEDVAEGEAFSPSGVKFKSLLRRGDTVLVDGDAVQAYGRALSDGALGEYVRVEFPETKKVVQCCVTGAGAATMVRGE